MMQAQATNKDKFRVTIGADPEAFIVDVEKSMYIPALGLIEGEKGSPVRIPGSPKNNKTLLWHPDNAAVEFNFGVHTAADELYIDIDRANSYARSYIKTLNHNFRLAWVPVADFVEELLADPRLNKIGCDPDFCAYEQDGERLTPRDPPDIKKFGSDRFAGGHIHLGYDNRDIVPPWAVAMLLDAFVATRLVARGYNNDRRQKFYGLAGLFRSKKYGVEYRTMSSQFLEHSSTAIGTFQAAIDIGNIVSFKPDETASLFQRIPWKDVRRAIDTGAILDCEALYVDLRASYRDCIGESISTI